MAGTAATVAVGAEELRQDKETAALTAISAALYRRGARDGGIPVLLLGWAACLPASPRPLARHCRFIGWLRNALARAPQSAIGWRKSADSLNFAMLRTRVALLAAMAAALLVAVAAAEEVQPQTPLLRTGDAQQDSSARLAVSWTQDEVAGVLLAALAVFVAAGGGTGGGGVLDPIYILIMGLDPKTAIPLSSVTIVGGAIANFLFNVQRTQKNSTEPLIDWDFILMMQPMLLLGAGVGTFLNRVIPTSMLCILLVLILSVTGVRTLQKAIEARRKERWLCCTRPQEETAHLNSSIGSTGVQINTVTYHKSIETDEPQRAVIPWLKIGALFGLFFGVLLLNLLRGTSKFPSPLGVSASSGLSTLLTALPFGFLAAISYLSWKNIRRTFHKQQQENYEPSPHEIKWTSQSIWYFPLLSVAAGTVSGMFGIGGGIINGPLLLEIGVDPAAASAMTATTVLFSSGMSAFQYVLAGSVETSLASVLFPMGFAMTYVGHACLMKVIQRFNCPSMIVFSMAIVVLVSAVAMSVESVRSVLGH